MDEKNRFEQQTMEGIDKQEITQFLPEHVVTNNAETTRSLLAYPGSPLPHFTKGKGIYLIDDKDQLYLDAVAGTFNVSLGYAHPDVNQAVNHVIQSGLNHVSSSFTNEHVERAATALVGIAPPSIEHCHFKGCTGGSTAMEQAMRASLIVTGRRTFVGFRNGHHGQTIVTTAVSGMPFRRNRLPVLSLPVVNVPSPDCYRCPVGRDPQSCKMECTELVKEALDNPPSGENDVCAFIAEPILGAGGGITPPLDYWSKIQEILHVRDIPLIFDEVQTFGRTGHFFASQYFQVEPDMITLAKGISGIGIPGAGALLSSRRFSVLKSYERSLTWGASPLTCAAIAATVKVMRPRSFFDSTCVSANVLAERLQQLYHRYDCIGVVRGVGLMTGIEIVRSRLTREPYPELAYQIVKQAMKHRLLLRLSLYDRGAFIKIRPPLIITASEVEDLCDRLELALADALS